MGIVRTLVRNAPSAFVSSVARNLGGGNSAALTNARGKLRFEALEDRRLLAVISIGSGDGSVTIDVDGYGAFGRSQGGTATGDAIFDPLGPDGPIGMMYESAVAFGAGSNRQFFSDGSTGSNGGLSSVALTVSGDGKSAISSFALSGLSGSLASLNGLQVTLVQRLTPVLDGTAQIGALLTQTYVMTNSTASVMPFDLVRYADVDVVDTGSSDGGGRVIVEGTEWIVTTGADQISDLTDPDRFVSIAREGGATPTTNRFEVDNYDVLLESTVIAGGNLDGLVLEDGVDADELIDNEPYDTTGALRSTFSLGAGAKGAFVTYTLFGDGVPLDVLADANSSPPESPLGPPKVANVTISGSASTHAPFAFDGPNDATDFDGSGIQLRTVPVGGADSVSIHFNEHVSNVTAGSLTLRGLRAGATPALAAVGGFVYDATTQIATWKFSAPLAADQYLISLSDAVTDVAGNAMDGEWINPFSTSTSNSLVSEFPSGNGTAGGSFRFVFTILPGDANLNNYGDGSDFLLWQSGFGGPGRSFIQGDFNGSGTTDNADLTIWQNHNGLDLHRLIFADYNHDGVVSTLDYNIWATNFGMTSAAHGDGDGDGDGDVDGSDYLLWSRQFNFRMDWVS